jgi:hypothetical protein
MGMHWAHAGEWGGRMMKRAAHGRIVGMHGGIVCPVLRVSGGRRRDNPRCNSQRARGPCNGGKCPAVLMRP